MMLSTMMLLIMSTTVILSADDDEDTSCVACSVEDKPVYCKADVTKTVSRRSLSSGYLSAVQAMQEVHLSGHLILG